MEIIVIGGGPGGTEAAAAAVRDGHRVTIIEQDRFGGTCTNRGCIPTKFLMSAVIRERAAGGIVSADAWKKIQARKSALVSGLSRKIEKDLAESGVDVIRGRGEFTAPGEVTIKGADGSTAMRKADAFVLATGCSPALIPSFNIDRKRVLTSNEVMDLEYIPASITIIGSGFIGTEYARIFDLLGSRVTLVEALEHMLPAEDNDTAAVIRKEFERTGIEVLEGTKVSSVSTADEGVKVVLDDGRSLSSELALVSVGRTPETTGIGLEAAGLSAGPGGIIEVNDYLETGAPGVFAVGDITGRYQLAHMASKQGAAAAGRISGGSTPVSYRAVPWAIFVSPEVATVGLTEKKAAAEGIKYNIGKAPMTGNIKARLDADQGGFIKILADVEDGRLLGGTIVSPRASDMIHTLAVAIESGMTTEELQRTIFVHPSLSESFTDALRDLHA